MYFLGISVFHSYQRIRKLKLFQDVRKSYRLKKQSDEMAYKEQSLEIISHTSVHLQLREPLLDGGCKSQN